MKTCLLFLCALLLAPGVWSQSAGSDAAALENKLAEQTRQAACPLHAFYREQLETYYNRTDFTDPEHKTGWYRVQDFLDWLQRAEPALKAEKINIWTEKIPVCAVLQETREENTVARKRLAVYLGARYALNRLGYDNPPDEVSFFIHPRRGASDFKNKTLYIPAPRIFSVPEFINLGVHEITHLLPLLVPDQPQEPLGELAAFYSQTRFALPLRPSGGVCFSNGVRHIVNTLGNTDACAQILNEYNSFLAGAVLKDKIRAEDLLSYRVEPGWDRSVSEVLFHLMLLENGKLAFAKDKKTYMPSAEQYVSALLPKKADYKPLLRFYKQWIKRLPDLHEALQNAPVLTLDEPGRDTKETPQAYFARQSALEHFVAGREKRLEQTLLQTFKENGAQTPVVPDGFI